MIQWLIATSEGDNTFWGITNFKTLKEAQKHKGPIYRDNKGMIEVLQGSEEGPNTVWSEFDPYAPSVEFILEICPPADKRTVLRNVHNNYSW